MPDTCICYTTDAGYPLPSPVSALQVRRRVAAAKADVTIIGFGLDRPLALAAGMVCESEGIELVARDRAALDGAPVLMARLRLPALLPRAYARLLYIDGDTLIDGALDPLPDHPLVPGTLLGANDPMAFSTPARDADGRRIEAHFRTLGIRTGADCRYLNSGVLYADHEGWERIGGSAWSIFERRGMPRFKDQDLLNLASAGRQQPMSLAWNFPILFANARVVDTIRPRIRHFMSNPKPWDGVFPPWTHEAHAPYRTIVSRYPALSPLLPGMPPRTRMRYHPQQRAKHLIATVTSGSGARRRRILAYETGVAVARPVVDGGS